MDGKRWIVGLEVSEEFQGHDYGIDLLQIAVDEFGADYLSVSKDNERAIHMYQTHGWSIDHEADHTVFMKLNEGNDF
jgi:ribosomal protein S18 acetylase RimI-like enzyme